MLNVKLRSCQARIAGAPKIISTLASEGIDVPRIFYGTGAPSSSTLPTGNGKYNGLTSGYVTSVSLVNPGTGYAVGNVLGATGGSGSGVQITVDAVSGGAITDWHVSTVGDYTAYPTNPVATAVTGGVGVGATFNVNFPPADIYYDVTTLSAPVMYICTTHGSKSTAVWAQIGGGGSSIAYFAITGRGTSDYLTCNQVTGITNSSGVAVASTISGASTLIAKQQNMRRSIAKENYDGVTYTYATPSGGDLDNNRTSTDGTTLQAEYVYPRYRTQTEVVADAYYTGSLPLSAQCFILAQQVTPNAGVVVSGAMLSWVECGPYRVWDAV